LILNFLQSRQIATFYECINNDDMLQELHRGSRGFFSQCDRHPGKGDG